MKRNPLILLILLAVVTTIVISVPSSVNSQKKAVTPNTDIPEDVMKVLSVSCMPCHSDNGSGSAKIVLNFSAWKELSPKKQVKRAASCCRAVTNGTMPPKSFVSKNPEAEIDAAKIEIICNWSRSLVLQ